MLYEMMCLRLPFDGSSMKQLCHNIIHANPSPPSSTMYSIELRDLVKDLLLKNPKVRPGINSILSKPIIRVKIASLLGATKHQAEFSHTILHGLNVLKDNNNIGAPPPSQQLLPRIAEVVKPYPSDDSRQQAVKKVEPARVEDIELEKWKARREAEKLRVVEEEKQKARRVEAEKLKLIEEAKMKARRAEAEKLQLYQMERLRVHREAEKLKVIEEERLKVRKEADRIKLVVEGRNKIKLDAERMQQMEIDRLKARRDAEKMRLLAEEKLKVRREADKQLRLIAEGKQKAKKLEAEKLKLIEVEKLKARRDAELKLRVVEEDKIKARKEVFDNKLRMVAEEEKQKVKKAEAAAAAERMLQIQAVDKIKAPREAEKQLRLMEEEKGKVVRKDEAVERLRVIEGMKLKAKKLEAERLQQIEVEKLKAHLHAEKLNSESEIRMKNPPSDENQPVAQIIVPKIDRNRIVETKDDFSLTSMFSEMGQLQNQMKLIKQIKLPLKSKQPEPTAAAAAVVATDSKPLLVSKSDNSLVIENMRKLVSKDQASIDQNRNALVTHNNNNNNNNNNNQGNSNINISNKIIVKDAESLVSPSRDAMKLQSKLKLEIHSKGINIYIYIYCIIICM